MYELTRKWMPLVLTGIFAALPTTARAKRVAASNATVIVEIAGCRSNRGMVRVALFGSAKGFPSNVHKAVAVRVARIKSRRCKVRFGNLPAGTYAAIAYHDENGNGRLDKNWLGFPKEPTGASHEKGSRRGPPTFGQSRFRVSAGSRAIKINLR